MKMNNLSSSFPDQGMVHSKSSESSIAPKIILKSTFNLINPSYDPIAYFNYYPSDLEPFPEILSNPVQRRFTISHIHLPLTSKKFNLNVYLLGNKCQSYVEFASAVDEAISGLDSHIVSEWTNSHFILPYLIEFKTHVPYFNFEEENYLQLDYISLRSFYTKPYLEYSIPKTLNCITKDKYFKHHLSKLNQHATALNQLKNIDPIRIKFVKKVLEETSLIKGGSNWEGVKHAIASVWNFATNSPEKLDDAKKKVEIWLLELADLFVNFNIKKLLFSLLKLLNEYFSITDCMDYIISLMHRTYTSLVNSLPKQPFQGIYNSIEETSLIETMDLTAYTNNAPSISAAFAVAVTVFANVICTKSLVDNKSNDNLTTKLAKAFYLNSRAQSAIVSVVQNIISFSKHVYETTFTLLLGDKSSAIYSLIQNTSVQENDTCKKADIFNYLEFLEHPANLNTIHTNQANKSQLEFCHSIFTEISIKLTTEDHREISSQVREYVKTRLIELGNLRKHVYKRPTVDPIRFCPYWINILGNPGIGKSVFMPVISNYLYEVLSKIPNEDFELTSKDRWVFPVNFSDEYLTHYNGHYVVSCDDFLQDAPGTLTQSSALKVITWISSIPSYTVQAAIQDKGTPFTSKIFLSTSNDKHMNRSNEITTPEALIRRMGMCVELFEDPTMEFIDPMIGAPGKKVRIRKLDKFNRNNVLHVYENAKEFLTECLINYILWYRDQQRIIKMNEPLCGVVSDISARVMDRCGIPNPSVTDSIVKQATLSILKDNVRLQETSSYWCKIGANPPMKTVSLSEFVDKPNRPEMVVLHDCECSVHWGRNDEYQKYLSLIELNLPSYDIRDFEGYEVPTLTQQFKRGMCDLYEKVKRIFKKVWSNPTARFITFALLTVSTAYSGYSMLNKIGNSSVNNSEKLTSLISTVNQVSAVNKLSNVLEPSQAKYSQKVVRAKNYRANVLPRVLEATDADFEPILSMTISKQSYDLAYSNIIKNGAICQLYFIDELNRTHINTGLRIAGRAILSNHHFFKHLKEGDTFAVKYFHQATGFQQVQQQFYSASMYQIPNTDVVVYHCSKSFPQGKDLTRHFQSQDTVLLNNQEALIVTRHPANSTPIVMSNVTVTPNPHNYTYGELETYTVLNSYLTNCPVEKGMSGSILISTDTRLKQKILGVQTCRDANTLCGYFQPICLEQLKTALQHLKVDQFICENKEIEMTKVIQDDAIPPNIVDGGSLSYIGKVPRIMTIQGQTTTKIEPSLVQDQENLTQEPSVLSDFDPRMKEELQGKSVIFRAIEGFNSASGSVDVPVLQRAVKDLSLEYDVQLDCANIPRRLLDDNEMINGVPQVINRIEMKSSPGYPLVLQRKDTTRSGKFEWFEEVTPLKGYGKTYVMTKDLASGLKQHEEAMLNGIKPSVIAYACLKDETRQLSKIESGSTRAFVCLPLIFNLLIRKYFGAFVASQHQKAGIITSCVGVNPATQWKQLYDKLMAKSDLWEDFDYKNWDQHLLGDFVLSVADIVNKFYGDANDSPAGRLRYMLLYDLVFTHIIVKNRLFLKSTGQCSGCAITAELNCLVHDILMYYVWLKVNKDKNIETTLHDYRSNVASIMYGDDIVMSVTPECKPLFNGNIIKPYMDALGMKITPGDKVSTEFVPKLAKDILFLKRSFIKDGDYVKAPLRSDIVENISQWIHKSDNSAEATRVNCETSIRESYMHGKNYFMKVLASVNERIKQHNRNNYIQLKPIVLDYDVLDDKYRNSEYICAGLPSLVSEDLW